MASMSNPNSSEAARRAARMARGTAPKPAPKQKLMVDPKPINTDAKLLAKLPVTQAHLNTIKKYYGV